MHRFFVDPAQLGAERVALGGPLAHQIGRVLRLRPGTQIVLLDGAGQEYLVRLEEVRSSAVVGVVEEVRPTRPEPTLRLTLYQALVPRDRFELVLQKGTEVGIARFVPVWCARSIVPGGDRIDERRMERWRRIVTEAAEQCERGHVPDVAPPLRLADALTQAAEAGPVLIAWEREDTRSVRAGLRAALGVTLAPPGGRGRPSPPAPLRGANIGFADIISRARARGSPHGCAGGSPDIEDGSALTGEGGRLPLGLFVGPEGGFTADEISQAREAGAITVSLGPRILRTETAGPILAALALYERGDLDPPSHLPALGSPESPEAAADPPPLLLTRAPEPASADPCGLPHALGRERGAGGEGRIPAEGEGAS